MLILPHKKSEEIKSTRLLQSFASSVISEFVGSYAPIQIVLKELRLAWFGSCAMGCREPCQVRKEAAISGSSYVPQISLLQRHARLFKGNFRNDNLMKISLTGKNKGRVYVYRIIQEPQAGGLRRDTRSGTCSKNIEESSGLRVCESRISLLRYQRNR